jgi:short-subunit dehydrogenase
MGINFCGVVWGTLAFLPQSKKSGDGHIVTTSSLFGLLASPTQGTYNSSKFAVRGFAEALRQELDLAPCGVSAACVHPGGICTHIARVAKMAGSMDRTTGGQAEAPRSRFEKMPNVTTAEGAARQILKAVERKPRRVLVGPDAKLMDLFVRLLGSWYQPGSVWLSRKLMEG